MQDKFTQMMKEEDKPTKQYTLDVISPFPFDKDLCMPPCPRGVELPKYDKKIGMYDTQDHLRDFDSLSTDFIHDKTYLMEFFPHGLGGKAMEWLS